MQSTGSPLLDVAPVPFALAHLVYARVLGFWLKGK